MCSKKSIGRSTHSKRAGFEQVAWGRQVMIIFFERGQLGNQLFQYCAMRKFQPRGSIIAIGLTELKAAFSGVDLVGATWFGKLLERIVRRVGEQRINYVARELRIFTVVEEDFCGTGVEFKVTPGLLRQIAYFKAGFYQAENIGDTYVNLPIKINPEIYKTAGKLLDALPCRPDERFFVHVRRGDYAKWPSPNASALLPLNWYLTQITRIRKAFPSAFFIIVSDDLPYVVKFLSDLERVYISNSDKFTDFALMAQCMGGGILSASTFSWWAAHFARQANPKARFIAPLYWGGFRMGGWYPPEINTSWLEYQSVT